MSIKVAVVGAGIWGKNLVRNFYNLGVLHSVCDLDPENLETISREYPDVKLTSDFNELLKNSEVSGIAIATPSHTHYPLVKLALNDGKHVYVEKPIAVASDEAQELNLLAEEKERVLMVGHLLLYHPVVNRLKTLISEGHLGKIQYVESDRLNINFFKNDRSVMWDLAPHDLSMVSYLLGMPPVSVKSAVGFSTNDDGVMDIVHLDIMFPENIHAHISNSWIHPQKRVLLLARGTKATAIIDDTEPVNKLHIYDNFSADKRTVEYPDYLPIEPLKLECQHFINCIINKCKARSDGENGYLIVKTLEEAERLMLGKNYNKIHNLKLATSRSKKV